MAAQSRTLPAILLTRPEEQSHRFAAALGAALGADAARIVISPLIAPRFFAPALPPGGFAGLVLTSQAGAEAARRISASGLVLPARAFCVGRRTAAAATEAGFEAISAEGDAAALVALLLERAVPGPLLHLCGQNTIGAVAERLSAAGIPTTAHLCYEQVAVPLNPSARTLLSGATPVVVPLFSPRSARLFCAEALAPPHAAPLLVAAMSAAVADALPPLQPLRCVIAAEPTAPAMVAAVAALLHGKTPA